MLPIGSKVHNKGLHSFCITFGIATFWNELQFSLSFSDLIRLPCMVGEPRMNMIMVLVWTLVIGQISSSLIYCTIVAFSARSHELPIYPTERISDLVLEIAASYEERIINEWIFDEDICIDFLMAKCHPLRAERVMNDPVSDNILQALRLLARIYTYPILLVVEQIVKVGGPQLPLTETIVPDKKNNCIFFRVTKKSWIIYFSESFP